MSRSISLIEGFKKKIDELSEARSWGTKNNYQQALIVYQKYLKHIRLHDIELIEITPDWLRQFSKWYKSQPNRKNPTEGISNATLNKRLSGLGHIINQACQDPKEKMKLQDNPLLQIKLESVSNKKKALEIDQLDWDALDEKFKLEKVANVMDLFRQLPLEKDSLKWHHRNCLFFAWNCQGMDFVDIVFLKRGSIKNKTLQYERSKVGAKAQMMIDLTEEAIEILNLYDFKNKESHELVFPFMKDIYNPLEPISEYVYSKYYYKLRKFNKSLQQMGRDVGFESNFTSKVIRHTWAQAAYDHSQSIDIVRQGLGHQTMVTSEIYVSDLKKREIAKINDLVTTRMSTIISREYKTKIHVLNQYTKRKKEKLDSTDFKTLLLKRIEECKNEVKRILSSEHFHIWTEYVNFLADNLFETNDEIDRWMNCEFIPFCDKNGIKVVFPTTISR